jgi:phage-related protein
MKGLRVHKQVSREIDSLDLFTRQRLTELFSLLMAGESLGMPVSRPMPIITHGAHEIRLKDHRGRYRVFYYVKGRDAVLVFHFIKKDTQTTPHHEIEVARKRLEDML